MLPFVVYFEIPQFDSMFVPVDPMSPAIVNIAQKFDVTFTTKGVRWLHLGIHLVPFMIPGILMVVPFVLPENASGFLNGRSRQSR